MKFSLPLEKTQLIKRYKRFLADVIHPQKGELTAHCPNTGSMKNCWEKGWNAWLLDSQNPKRKYSYTWVLTENEAGDYIGINTHFANEIVYEGIIEGRVKELAEFNEIKKEVKYGEENSRIDIFLTDNNNRNVFVEIKSVTLLDETFGNGKGFFPDSVTTRGQKHLRELMHCVERGDRAVLLFLVQHTGIDTVSVADHIDMEYSNLLKQALKIGVEVLVYRTEISPSELKLGSLLPFLI